MAKLISLIVEYQVGDGCTYSSTIIKPVLASSKEAFVSDFELAMAAYSQEGPDFFVCGGQLFEYGYFLDWTKKQISKRRTVDTYDLIVPNVYTMEEWVLAGLKSANLEFEHIEAHNRRPVAVIGDLLKPSDAIQAYQAREAADVA